MKGGAETYYTEEDKKRIILKEADENFKAYEKSVELTLTLKESGEHGLLADEILRTQTLMYRNIQSAADLIEEVERKRTGVTDLLKEIHSISEEFRKNNTKLLGLIHEYKSLTNNKSRSRSRSRSRGKNRKTRRRR